MTDQHDSRNVPTSNWTRASGTEPGRRPVSEPPAHRALRTVVVVSRHPHVQEVLELVAVHGNFDVIVVEPVRGAYGRIRRAAPDLVILCVVMDDVEGLQVLSMLKLDSRTSSIPVVVMHSMLRPAEGFDASLCETVQGAADRADAAARN